MKTKRQRTAPNCRVDPAGHETIGNRRRTGFMAFHTFCHVLGQCSDQPPVVLRDTLVFGCAETRAGAAFAR